MTRCTVGRQESAWGLYSRCPGHFGDGRLAGSYHGTAAEDGISYRSHGVKRRQLCGTDDEKLHNVEKLAIILGNGREGLAADTIADCDYTVCIPMARGVDSLNVAAPVQWHSGNYADKRTILTGNADKKHKFDRGILSIRQNNMVA